MDITKPFLTTKEAAQIANVTRRTVYAWMHLYRDTGGREGLRYVSHGHRTKRIHRADFLAFIEAADPVQ